MSNGTPHTNRPSSVEDLIERGKVIYAGLDSQHHFEQNQQGKYIAIDVNTGEYFVGETRDEAVQLGKAKFPEIVFYVRRIGGMDRVSRHFPSPKLQRSIRARLL